MINTLPGSVNFMDYIYFLKHKVLFTPADNTRIGSLKDFAIEKLINNDFR